ncbi:MAG: helix-turn-helix domain-containing protein [Bifidobacteriaceae bacterium]|jgi:predicted transcriptional regulator|nr:helix-turn-helix domain-containing protein [Bifidobacteriaceae bacterium]
MGITLDQILARRPIDPEKLDVMVSDLRCRYRAAHLADIRRQQAVTQVDLAKTMGTAQNRVSQIERGDIDRTRIATLRRYIEALGGTLHVDAEFGDTRYAIAG